MPVCEVSIWVDEMFQSKCGLGGVSVGDLGGK